MLTLQAENAARILQILTESRKRGNILHKQMIELEPHIQAKRVQEARIWETAIANAEDNYTKDSYQRELEHIQNRWLDEDEEANYKESESKVEFSGKGDDSEDDEEGMLLLANPVKHQCYYFIQAGDDEGAIRLIGLNRPQMSLEHDVFGHSLMHHAIYYKRPKVVAFIKQRVKSGLSGLAFR